jgi:hypothetical protein
MGTVKLERPSMADKFRTWLKENHEWLGALASIIQIGGVIVIVIGFIISAIVYINRLEKYIIKPDLHFVFSNPKSLAFTVKNNSDSMAVLISYKFNIYDLDTKPVQRVPILHIGTPFVKGYSSIGPVDLIGKIGIKGHRYFGYGRLTCDNCEKERFYSIYFVFGEDANAWFVEVKRNEYKLFNPFALLKNPEEYIKRNFPVNQRIAIFSEKLI